MTATWAELFARAAEFDATESDVKAVLEARRDERA